MSISGKPLYGTLIALLEDGVSVLGIIDQPYIGERWVGVAGSPTLLNGQPIQTRTCELLNSAYMYSTSPDMFEGKTWESFKKIRDKVCLTSPICCFCR